MQNANNLNTSLNNLNVGEASALADINRRTTLANDAYNTGLAGANANIEANFIQNLLNERQKEWERQMQERQLAENIRQFNENLALQRQQLYSRFSGGSGGGGGSNSGSSNNEEYNFTDSQSGYADTGKWVNVDMGNKTQTAKVYQGADGKLYYKYNNKYIPVGQPRAKAKV